MGRISLGFWLCFVGFLLVVGATTWVMFSIRSRTLAEWGDEHARVEWQKWKADAATQDGTTSPVQRSAPKGDDPPLLMLMRDRFAGTLIALLVPTSVLYWFLVWIIRGVIKSPGPRH